MNMRMTVIGQTVLAATFILLGSHGHTAPSPQQFISVSAQVTLVELYTSEGCSSCPPADRWLSSLKDHPELWKSFVPVALHVDYWDYIGWRDRFASAEFSNRQRQYAKEGGVRTVYTPGLFRNGEEWRGWFRGRQPGINDPTASGGTLSIDILDGSVNVGYLPPDPRGGEELVISVALLGVGLETSVKAGENRGRNLAHDFVVVGLSNVPLQRNGKAYTATLDLPAPSVKAEQLAVAAWVSSANRQAPLQAVGGYLQPPDET